MHAYGSSRLLEDGGHDHPGMSGVGPRRIVDSKDHVDDVVFGRPFRVPIQQNTNNKEKKMQTIHLTKSEFLAKVADYETSPNEWKYLDNRPAIIDSSSR